jgi:hypothetical protein
MPGNARPNRPQIKQYKRKADKGELAALVKKRKFSLAVVSQRMKTEYPECALCRQKRSGGYL